MTKRPTILVVDDEIDVIESIKDLLRLEFEVVGAESADAGLAVLAARPVAVVMSDQRMPGTTGVEFLSRVKERYPDATRLLFTGFADLRAVIGAINEGSVYRYVAKPWDPDDLANVLRDAVRRHELLTERDRLHAELGAAHEALRASEAQYRLLFERNPNPMWVVDVATGRIMAVNAATLRHYGYELDAMLTMRADDLELDAARDSAPPDVPHRPARHRRADGGVIEVELTAERVPFDGREAELVMARDVTLQRQLEAHFRQEQKMEALGLMAGGIAHDFGNLMATLQLGARVLRDRVPADDPLRMLADEIVSHADRGTTLTRQLLAFSRRQPGTVEHVDLNEVLRDMEKVLRRVVGPDARLDLDLTPGLEAFLGDRAQIEQVVLNLVLNARDATEGRGRVSVATRPLTIAARGSGAWTAASPGRYVALSVTDDGPGVDAATQRRIFDPFFTTKPEGKGTGLGLATVFSIAQQHRGAVRCESAPGQGARFEVILPAAPARRV